MKHNNAKKPTKKQRIFLEKCGFNFSDWLIMTDTKSEIKIICRHTGTVKTITKN